MKLDINKQFLFISPVQHCATVDECKYVRFVQILSLKHTLLLLILIVFYDIGIPSISLALESDRDKPVHIKADNVKINEKTGISVYTGDVIITQGSMSLQGSKVTVYQQNGTLKKIIVLGQPAQFKQLADKTQQTIIATALQLEYLTLDEQLILTDSAVLKHGQNRFSGQTITYNTRNSTVNASTSDDSEQRVNAIIVPQTQENQ